MTEQLDSHFSLSCIGQGNGNPLQCSCLESPRGGGAWWAAVYGVAQSRTRLKRLSSLAADKQHSSQGPGVVQVSGPFQPSGITYTNQVYAPIGTRGHLILLFTRKPAFHSSYWSILYLNATHDVFLPQAGNISD